MHKTPVPEESAEEPPAGLTPTARFFSGCPQRDARSIHQEENPWDLHSILYSTAGLLEIEVLRIADWMVDLAVPGRPIRPFQKTVRVFRAGYHRLPDWTLRHRTGELFDALQIPELSLGDASAAYTVYTGGVARPTSGTVVRVEQLIDWTQRVTGDANWLAGRLIGMQGRLIAWSGPRMAVDGMQWVLLKTFNTVTILLARMVDAGATGLEAAASTAVNLGHRRPHARTTVFLILPRPVFESHERWVRRMRHRLVAGDAASFRASTHAQLAHRRRGSAQPPPAPGEDASTVVVMTDVKALAGGPRELYAYVVPATWVLEETRVGAD
jgi:hypothetical protein